MPAAKQSLQHRRQGGIRKPRLIRRHCEQQGGEVGGSRRARQPQNKRVFPGRFAVQPTRERPAKRRLVEPQRDLESQVRAKLRRRSQKPVHAIDRQGVVSLKQGGREELCEGKAICAIDGDGLFRERFGRAAVAA
ncbi:MAG TPA: hypothetical protein PLF78_13125, partial [Caulobacter sp.]|nr:hypothetical protein [Caulobacter sp.]